MNISDEKYGKTKHEQLKNALGWNNVVISQMKQLTFVTPALVFPRNDIEEWVQKVHIDDVTLLELCSTSDWFKKCALSNQKHFPDMGSDAPPVWNFYAR